MTRNASMPRDTDSMVSAQRKILLGSIYTIQLTKPIWKSLSYC